jgi:hypothetical protein
LKLVEQTQKQKTQQIFVGFSARIISITEDGSIMGSLHDIVNNSSCYNQGYYLRNIIWYSLSAMPMNGMTVTGVVAMNSCR